MDDEKIYGREDLDKSARKQGVEVVVDRYDWMCYSDVLVSAGSGEEFLYTVWFFIWEIFHNE